MALLYRAENRVLDGRLVRNRLAENFVADLCADWLKNGAAVITKVRTKHPTAYLRTIASLVPRDLPEPTRNEFDRISDAELIVELEEAVARLRASSELPD